MKNPTEYDVSFAVKEWLLDHEWSIIAFNPPGAQGTFSIPNPSKDPKYKGQTGTESPDIIAVKEHHALIVECKPYLKQQILGDVDKILKLVMNKERMEILHDLIVGMCKANEIELNTDFHTIIAVGYGGELILTEIKDRTQNIKKILNSMDDSQIQTFHIEITDKNRGFDVMVGSEDPISTINATLYPTDCDIKEILLCEPI